MTKYIIENSKLFRVSNKKIKEALAQNALEGGLTASEFNKLIKPLQNTSSNPTVLKSALNYVHKKIIGKKLNAAQKDLIEQLRARVLAFVE